jgi:hypothetical protein
MKASTSNWIEVRLVRTTTTASVIVYSTGLMDVF